MIIKDTDGERLELSSTRLKQIGLGTAGCFLRLKDLREAINEGLYHVPIHFIIIQSPIDKEFFNTGLAVARRIIGCCQFSPRTFAKILKAAGVKKARKKKVAKK